MSLSCRRVAGCFARVVCRERRGSELLNMGSSLFPSSALDAACRQCVPITLCDTECVLIRHFGLHTVFGLTSYTPPFTRILASCPCCHLPLAGEVRRTAMLLGSLDDILRQTDSGSSVTSAAGYGIALRGLVNIQLVPLFSLARWPLEWASKHRGGYPSDDIPK